MPPRSQSRRMRMKLDLLSLGPGLLVGVVYGLIDVRSPPHGKKPM